MRLRGHVIWIRHRQQPDITPTIRVWFSRYGFSEVAFDYEDGLFYGVGTHLLAAEVAARPSHRPGCSCSSATVPPRLDDPSRAGASASPRRSRRASLCDVKYLLMIYGNADKWASYGPEQWRDAIDRTEAWLARYRETGEMLGAYGLADAVNAKLVRRGAGEPTVTDGPYLETKEYLASFYLVDCENEARAYQIAADMPAAEQEPVEVWPILHESTGE